VALDLHVAGPLCQAGWLVRPDQLSVSGSSGLVLMLVLMLMLMLMLIFVRGRRRVTLQRRRHETPRSSKEPMDSLRTVTKRGIVHI
jgi:hypothetical protein